MIAPQGWEVVSSKLAAAWSQARYLPRALGLAWAAGGTRSLVWLALIAFQGLVPVCLVYLSRPLVDALGGAPASVPDATRIGTVLQLGGAVAALLLLAQLLRSASEWLRADQAQRLEDHLSAVIHEKSTSVDLAFYESAEFHDHLHRARDEARHRPVALLQNAGSLMQNAITLLGVALLLAPYGWWIAIALLASTLPAFVVVLRFAVLEHRYRHCTTLDERRSSYFDWIMTAPESAAELRLFHLAPRFRDAYNGLRKRLRVERLKLARAHLAAEVVAGAAALVLAGACLVWAGWHDVQGRLAIGDVALFYFAFSQGQQLMRSLLASVGQLYYNVLFLGNLFAFLDLSREVVDPELPVAVPELPLGSAIAFKDVTFRYPGSERAALRNFDLEIPAGQVAAVVGVNGAGKSTLLKLICRFYDPQAGCVERGGIDLRRLAVDAVRARVTALFQQPVRYHASVAENIAPSGASASAVSAAAESAGAAAIIARLPGGQDTLLGRWFGGVELSVGEWQRIALARAFIRRTPVILLDEPTSAMDSWAEADWMNRFRTLCAGRTALIVTHRFTTAMRADVIHVMEEGRVIESGTHDELIARHGRYSQSWQAQMREERGARVANA